MPSMSYKKIRKLVETKNVEKANTALDEGYELLKILQTKRTDVELDETKPCHILGLGANSP